MAKFQQFLSRIGSNRDRAALRGIFSQFLTDGDPPALKDLVLASIVLSGAETTQITISGACTTGILISGACTTGLALTGVMATGITMTGCIRGISFDGIDAPANAGNYGQTLDCTWLDVDPGSGGSHGAKLMFSNIDASGYVLYGVSLRTRSYATSAKVVGFNSSGSAAVAASGQVMGGEFYLQNSGAFTINDLGGLPSCALHVKSWLDAACSQVASALWIDDESDVKATTQHMVDITMNGDALIDNVFHVYGGDPGATNLFHFDTCDQGAGAFCIPGATGAGTANVKLKCKFGSTTFYLQGYAT